VTSQHGVPVQGSSRVADRSRWHALAFARLRVARFSRRILAARDVLSRRAMIVRGLFVACALSLAWLTGCGGSVAPDPSPASAGDDGGVDTSTSPPEPGPYEPQPEAGPHPAPVDSGTGIDGGSTGADTRTSVCCPIDDHPSCCMNYGGSPPEFFCGEICDGLPEPTDPRWERRIDGNGCPYWYAPPEIPIGCWPFAHDTGIDSGVIYEAAPPYDAWYE
jgi:hypothetical protein